MSQREILLGKSTHYFDEYNPELLFRIPRSQGRSSLNLVPFNGYDLWRLYEVSYLNTNGLPQCCMATIKIPCTSPYIVESKSLKLYMGSFSQTMLSDAKELSSIMTHDLNEVLSTHVTVELLPISAKSMELTSFSGTLLESESTVVGLKIKSYEVESSLLQKENGSPLVSESVYTNLFRSLCPVTSQPDFASVEISYSGPKINHASLLSYLISFRKHQGFHEQCVERIFCDIRNKLKIEDLTVCACFTRRGGIDISPIRTSAKDISLPIRTPRQ